MRCLDHFESRGSRALPGSSPSMNDRRRGVTDSSPYGSARGFWPARSVRPSTSGAVPRRRMQPGCAKALNRSKNTCSAQTRSSGVVGARCGRRPLDARSKIVAAARRRRRRKEWKHHRRLSRHSSPGGKGSCLKANHALASNSGGNSAGLRRTCRYEPNCAVRVLSPTLRRHAEKRE